MKRYKAWLGVLLSAFFLYLAFRKSDFGQIWKLARQADYLYFLLGLPLMFFTFWLRALRWRYLLLPAGRPSIHSLFGAIMIGYMSLNVLPFRLGEFIRAYVLGRRENLPKSGVFATIVVERLFDGFTVLLFIPLPLLFLPFSLSPGVLAWVRAFSVLALVIYASAVTFLVLIKLKMHWVIGTTEWVLKRFPRLRDFAVRQVLAFADGLKSVASLRLFLIIAVYSLLLWLGYAAFYWLIMFAFTTPEGVNLGVQAGALGGVFLLAAIALGIMLPSSPGFVGVFELACITALAAMGVDRTLAESYAILVHAIQFIPVTLTGIIYLYLQNFTFKEIRSSAENQAVPAAVPEADAS